MSLKPCLICGVPSEQTRCEEHTFIRPRQAWTARDTWRWRRLSRRLRTLQPWCSVLGCGDTDLTVDHIVPIEHGGAVFDVTNCQILCRSHNSAKGLGQLDTWGVDPPGPRPQVRR